MQRTCQTNASLSLRGSYFLGNYVVFRITGLKKAKVQYNLLRDIFIHFMDGDFDEKTNRGLSGCLT